MDEIKVLKQYQDDYCALYNGDSCEIVKMFDENSMDLMVYSPPFSSLYTYSNSDRDLGNSRSDEEFYQHLLPSNPNLLPPLDIRIVYQKKFAPRLLHRKNQSHFVQ